MRLVATSLLFSLVVAGCGGEADQALSSDGWALHSDAVPTALEDTAGIVEEAGLAVDPVAEDLFEGQPELITLTVPGDEAIAAWLRLRGLVGDTGRWPVVLGTVSEAEQIVRLARQFGQDPSEVLEEATRLDWAPWFDERSTYILDPFGFPESGRSIEPIRDPFEFLSVQDILSGAPLETVVIALVPTPVPWEVPAHLGWGGWNDNPSTLGHVVALRHWYDTYQAEVVAMTGDIVEMRVGKPPATTQQALELAREQYVYAYDIVDQGTGDLEVLAAYLVDSPGWFFWWD